MLPDFVVKIGFYLIGTLVAAGLVAGAYHVWKKGVQAEVAQKIVIEQLEKALAAQAEYARQQKVLQDKVDQLNADLRKQKEEVDRKMDEVEAAIDGAEDRPASDVLKDTIKKLGGQ